MVLGSELEEAQRALRACTQIECDGLQLEQLEEAQRALGAAQAEYEDLRAQLDGGRSRELIEAELESLEARRRFVRAELEALESGESKLGVLAEKVASLSAQRDQVAAQHAAAVAAKEAAQANLANAARAAQESEKAREAMAAMVESEPEVATVSPEEDLLSLHLHHRGVAIERRPGRGRCVVATCTLPAGTEVMSVAAVTAVLRPVHRGERCNCCLKRAEGKLLRCSGCRLAFYCSPACQKMEWPSHKRECGCLSKAAEQGLQGDALGDALLLGRVLHNEQRQRSKQPPNFYACSRDPPHHSNQLPLEQGVDAVKAMEWHEQDVDAALDLAQQAADAGFLPLEPPSATVSPVSSPQHHVTNSKRSKSKKKSRGAKKKSPTKVSKAVPVGGLRQAASRLAQFRCNNFGITDELLLPIGAGIFPAAALLNHSCSPNAALTYDLTRGARPRMRIRLLAAVEEGQEITHNFVDIALPTPERQRQLATVYHFDCNCNRCVRRFVVDDGLDLDTCMADGSELDAGGQKNEGGLDRTSVLNQADELLHRAM